jgi:LmbE family N-acetylglucosaminyl deacetylase
MLELSLGTGTNLKSVLLLGAHCDDLEIGCGGTVQKIVSANPNIHVHWVTLSSDAVREKEAREAASKLLGGAVHADVRIESFRNSFFPYSGTEIKSYFERLKRQISPDIVFTHYRHDLHQDHRVVNELTWNTYRNHVILEYEIPKFDGDLGVPNGFSPLTRAQLDRKTEVILECFESQRDKSWFTKNTFEALARLRGIECNAPEGFAEAFYIRKVNLHL